MLLCTDVGQRRPITESPDGMLVAYVCLGCGCQGQRARGRLLRKAPLEKRQYFPSNHSGSPPFDWGVTSLTVFDALRSKVGYFRCTCCLVTSAPPLLKLVYNTPGKPQQKRDFPDDS